MSQVEHASLAGAPTPEIEDLLLSEGLIDEKQLERARRIAGRLKDQRSVSEVLVELGQLARSEHDRVLRLHRSRMSLAEILQEEGVMDDAGVQAYREAKSRGQERSERDILVGGGLVTEERFLQAVSTKHDIPLIDPEVSLVDVMLLSRTSIPYLQRHRMIPLRIADGVLSVIMADPLDTELTHELERMYDVPVKPCGARSERIVEVLQTLDSLRDSKGKTDTTLQYRVIKAIPEDDEAGEGAVRVVDYLLYRAIEVGASDLHIEPLQTKVRVRVRVNGVLSKLPDLPGEFATRIAARIKVLAGVDIAERRLHQDGRFSVIFEGKEVDLRLSTYASMFGETLVLRLLDRNRGLIPLESLGLEPRMLSLLRDVILRSSSGLVLVTGPTGSGKTTTLYSFVDYVNDDTLKIITCENPVEYVLDGTTQCSVNEKTGPTFGDSLRSIVRQDPDIIVVGEIRDQQTAKLAVEAALTGHKVFATFHTEDAVTAVVRLLEMGVEPFLVASTLSCVLAQRLVRRICEHCRKPGEYSRKDLRYLGLNREEVQSLPILEGTGCARCNDTGYQGRSGIHEVLLLDDDFRDAILRRASSKEMRVLARQMPGFLTLQEDGLLKVVSGVTTLAEVADNAPRDPEARSLSAIQEVAAMRRFR